MNRQYLNYYLRDLLSEMLVLSYINATTNIVVFDFRELLLNYP
jgi:hypothetical protein